MSAKTVRAGSDGDPDLVPLPRPLTLQWILRATIIWSGLTIVCSVLLFAQRPYVRHLLIDRNKKAKSPKANYTGSAVDHDIHTWLIGGLIQSVLVSLILILLALLTTRGRAWARWVLLAFSTIVGVYFSVGVLAQLVIGIELSAPGQYKFTTIAAGLLALAVAVFLVMPDTSRYFKARRDILRAESGVPARPTMGLGAMFSPRRRLAQTPAARSSAPANPTAGSGGLTSGRLTSGDLDSGGLDSGGLDAGGIGADGAAGPDAGVSAGRPARRTAVTRPGSVKPKGTAGQGRSKSRKSNAP